MGEVAMQYEATFHFEVEDENVDLTDLISEERIDVHGVGLIGRTDEGEVASVIQMMWGGVVDCRARSGAEDRPGQQRSRPTTRSRRGDRQPSVGRDE
jgi:hypothetical protein